MRSPAPPSDRTSVFFFSSRRRHTRWNCDWSSDVCSSDLAHRRRHARRARQEYHPPCQPSPMIPLLKGLRILDLTSVILGPYATQILGDLGAEIIKIEPPEGDSMRPVAPQAAPGLSAIFANCNRNKRSVMLDLKTEAGKAALMKLLPTADAFVHNMRQQAMDKLGFTFKAVRAANPRIVYAAAIGFGRHGRYAGKPAYDDVIQAASGFAGLFQLRDGAPLYAPSIAADKVSGLHLAHAVLAALLYRERSGKTPGYVEVPMFELMAAFCLSEHLGHATFDDDGKVGYVRVLSRGR